MIELSGVLGQLICVLQEVTVILGVADEFTWRVDWCTGRVVCVLELPGVVVEVIVY